MSGSASSGPCRVRLLYRSQGCSWDELLAAGLVAAHGLLVSNGVRRDACVDLVVQVPPSCRRLHVRVHGARVKGLAPQETAVQGVMKAFIGRGRWPGVEELDPQGFEADACMPAARLVEEGVDPCSAVCIEVPGGLPFKPWWAAAAVMVLLDERCGCRVGSG